MTPCPNEWDLVHHPSYPDVWENVLSKTRDPYEIEKTYTDYYATHEEMIDLYRNHYAFHPIHGIFATQPLRRLKHCGKVIVAGAEDPGIPEHLGFDAVKPWKRRSISRKTFTEMISPLPMPNNRLRRQNSICEKGESNGCKIFQKLYKR